MKLSTALLALLLPTSAFANGWSSQIQDGIKFASIQVGTTNAIEVSCDVGINAPITAINFVLNDTVPMANSSVRLTFDKQNPMFLTMDSEGGIGSSTSEGAEDFNTVLAKLKASSTVSVRIFDGSEAKFALRGSSKAIGACEPDFARYQLAQQ
jgi:hypothetical protein